MPEVDMSQDLKPIEAQNSTGAPAKSATCPPRSYGKLGLLAVGLVLWIAGTVVHISVLSIAGMAVTIVGFVACGGA